MSEPMQAQVYCGEITEHLIQRMRKDGAPEEAVTQMLSMLLEMSSRLLYQDVIKVHPNGLNADTKKGLVELNFAPPGAQQAKI